MKTLTTPPKFQENQQVYFLGGFGKILFCQPDGTNWLYGVEMPLDTAPNFSRIGYETIVLISETELNLLKGQNK